MTYGEAISFLYKLRLFGTKLGLENAFRLAELTGNPHRRLRFIHVAGTNGKGSVCAMLESIYRRAGYRTGLFTSPHLVSFTERIQVDGIPIPQTEVVRHVREMLRLLHQASGTEDKEQWEFRPTFFEFITVMALRCFAAANCELIIWETGMGGRLDATNIVTPEAAIITNVQYDHQNWLGETREQIAAEKAGIIKPGVPVITAATAPEALEVIRRAARENNAPLAEITEAEIAEPFIARLALPLPGAHQKWNAAVALAAVRTLRHRFPVSDHQILDGLENVRWPGRQQFIQKGAARFLLDGAHNPDGAATLRDTLQELAKTQEITLIIGLFEDKDWRGMCVLLAPLAARLMLVPVQSERSAGPAKVTEFCARFLSPGRISAWPSLKEALEHPPGPDGITVIAGSLHLAGEALELLGLAAGAPSERGLNEWDASRASASPNSAIRTAPLFASSPRMATIAVLGTMDTKGEEHAYVADLIRKRGHQTLVIDTGALEPPRLQPDIPREEIAAAAGIDLNELVSRRDRGETVKVMSQGAPIVLTRLHREGKIDGVISLGGGGGTSIATAAMRALPIGFPKLMVSTLASGNTAQYVGVKDIAMLPSIVDVAGLNRISREILARAAGAICGMVESPAPPAETDKPLIAASMFGNTTDCVQHAKKILETEGYEVLVFHATGAGGRTMESLIESGMIDGVLDITTTEWADEFVGGFLGAGPHRLEAAANTGTPAVVTPGCLDMVNFYAPDSIPGQFRGRKFYKHNPQVTLMRTNPAENAEIGKIIAQKLNASIGPVSLLLPRKAISVISAPGQSFHDPEADAALFDAIKANLRPGIEVIEMDAEINDPQFAEACARALLKHIRSKPEKPAGAAK